MKLTAIFNARWKWPLLAFVTGMLLASILKWGFTKTASHNAHTTNGVVQGIMVEGVSAYLGIPYARPPVGDLRWESPRAPVRWKGILPTKEIPPHCVQSMFGFSRGQEDCLYLNVWTPSRFPEKPLPVIVWIHGGGFTVGHSYETTPGHRLAKKGNVVVVSMNYRLGALGFMAHPDLSSESAGLSGNYGMLDQILALHWVRNNIDNFGGDWENVTIVGESAGGMSVCNLLASPRSSKLFDKAVIQSGPCYSPYPDIGFMEKQGKVMEVQLGCDKVEHAVACMRSKSAEEILDAMPPAPGMVFGEEDEYWMPNIDGEILKEQPFISFEQGRFAKVPIMIGNNANEGSLLVMFGHEYQLRSVTPNVYPDRIHYLVRDDELVKQVMAQYPLENYQDAGEALTEVFGDSSFVCHERWASDALAKHVPLYSYYFSYPEADFVLPELRELGAFHSAEVQFLFDSPMAWLENEFSGEERLLSDSIISYWSTFARTGNPNDKQKTYPMWPNYGVTHKRLVIDKKSGIKPASDTNEVCEFWQKIAPRDFIDN